MSSETGKSNNAQDVHHNNAADNKGEYFPYSLRPSVFDSQLLVDPRKLLCQSVGLRFCFNFGSEQSAYRDIQNLRQLY